jgi:hypothetical protein
MKNSWRGAGSITALYKIMLEIFRMIYSKYAELIDRE